MKIDYRKYLLSPKWKDKREELFKLRGKKCEECSSTKKIHVHHLHYETLGDEKMEDLQVLCKVCHMKKHPNKFRSGKYVVRRDEPEHFEIIDEDFIVLNFTNINALRTLKGGVSTAMRKLVWGSGRPSKGWIKKCIGKKVPLKLYNEVLIECQEYSNPGYKDVVSKRTRKRRRRNK